MVRVIFSDGELQRRGGRLHLVLLDDRWHLVAKGFLCMVEEYQEGVQLMERIKAEGMERGVSIELSGHPPQPG